MSARDPMERLLSRIEINPETGCWEFMGARAVTGYGQMMIDRRGKYVHRVAYERLVGPISDGLVIDHLCRVRHCCNPDHLEPVTNRENIIRGIGWAATNAAKTHCPAGHAYAIDNVAVTRKNQRQCRECGRAACRQYYRLRERRNLAEVVS